jgi:dihydroorotase
MPQDYDSKVLEFEYAKNGMTALETCYAALHTAMPGIAEKRWVELLATNPRKIFGLKQSVLKEKEECAITIFSPAGTTWKDNDDFYSKSHNSPFAGKELQGKVYGTVVNGKSFFTTKKKLNGSY